MFGPVVVILQYRDLFFVKFCILFNATSSVWSAGFSVVLLVTTVAIATLTSKQVKTSNIKKLDLKLIYIKVYD